MKQLFNFYVKFSYKMKLTSLCIISCIVFIKHQNLEAKINSYFTITADRVMINLQSGYPFDPPGDEDAKELYRFMNVNPENSIMGKGKKILVNDVLSIIVADRGSGKYNGTIMVAKNSETSIDPLNKIMKLEWADERAQELFSLFESNKDLGTNNPYFEYISLDKKLKIESTAHRFLIQYAESIEQL